MREKLQAAGFKVDGIAPPAPAQFVTTRQPPKRWRMKTILLASVAGSLGFTSLSGCASKPDRAALYSQALENVAECRRIYQANVGGGLGSLIGGSLTIQCEPGEGGAFSGQPLSDVR